MKIPFSKGIRRLFPLLAIVCLIWFRPVASAHAYLLRSEPAANSTVAEQPQEVRLWFTEPVSPQFSGAQVLNLAGENIPVTIRMVEAEDNLLIVELPRLSDDVYTVLWRVHSTADGHVTQGIVVFGVGIDVDPSATTPTLAETTLDWTEIVLRWLNFFALMGLIGAVAASHVVLTTNTDEGEIVAALHMARQRVWYWFSWCSVLALLLGFLWLGWQAHVLLAELSEGVGWTTVTMQWLGSRLGWLWLVRQLLLLLLLAGRSWLARQKSPVLAGTTVVMLVGTQSLASHAAAVTPDTTLALVADLLHILAGGLWIGGLMALLFGFWPILRRQDGQLKVAAQAGWQPFGRMAATGAVVVIATGFYSTGRQVASIDALISTLYGRSLILKFLLVLAMGLIGAMNASLLHPLLRTPLARLLRRPEQWFPLRLQTLPLLLRLEFIAGLLVLLLAGLLTAAPTAHGPSFLPRAEIPDSLSGTSDDIVVNLAVKPNRPGQNVLDLRVASSRRPAPAPISRVIIRFRYVDQEFGITSVDAEEIEPGRYLVGGNELTAPGHWQIDVVVRRHGLEDSVVNFGWIVSDGEPNRPVLISNQPWESALTLAATGLLVLSLVLLLFTQRKNRETS